MSFNDNELKYAIGYVRNKVNSGKYLTAASVSDALDFVDSDRNKTMTSGQSQAVFDILNKIKNNKLYSREKIEEMLSEYGFDESVEVMQVLNKEVPIDVQASMKLVQLYKSANKRGIDFSLTIPHVKKLIKRKTCYYTGMNMTRHKHDPDNKPSPSDLTIDRIDNSIGYTNSNTVACSHAANQLKSIMFEGSLSDMKMSPDEFFNFATKMLEIYKKD